MSQPRDSQDTLTVRQYGHDDAAHHRGQKLSIDKPHAARHTSRRFDSDSSDPMAAKNMYKPNRADGKHELQDVEAWHELGFSFPTWKKWMILSTIFAVQCSMNYNASVYANGIPLLQDKFGVTEPVARLGQMIFLIAYAFGCELWAPPSESIPSDG
jgi:hypothetical protein